MWSLVYTASMSVNDLGAVLFDVIFTSHNVSAYSQPVWPAVYWANCRACDDHVMSEDCEIEAPFCCVERLVGFDEWMICSIYGKYCFTFIVKMHWSNCPLFWRSAVTHCAEPTTRFRSYPHMCRSRPRSLQWYRAMQRREIDSSHRFLWLVSVGISWLFYSFGTQSRF